MPDGGVSAAVFAASKIAASAALAATGSTAVASAAFSATSFILSAKGALLLTTAISQVAMSANRRLPDPGTEIELSIDSDEPRRWIVGKRMTSGSIADRVAFDSVGGDKFDTHALIIVLADHQVNRMVRVIGDGLQVHGALQHGVRTALPEYNADDVGGSVGRNRIWMTFYDGRPGQPADPNLIAKTTGFNVIGRWTSEHRLEGLPYVIVEMKYDDDSLTSYPKFQFELEGALLYDRRKDSTAGGDGAHRIDDPATWEYSTNPAVARDHYRQGVIHPSGVRLFGPGDAPEVDPYEDFAARADLCEETVSTLTGSQQRYEFNGIIRADEVYADVFERFAVQMGGEDADVGGRAIVIPAEAKTPVLTLYDGDVEQLASTGFSDKKTRAEKVTAIEGRFCDPRQLYQPVDYPRIQNPAWTAADGEKPRTLTLNLIDETNVERAQRLATLVAKRARREGVIAEEYLANAPVGGVSPLKLEVGDWFVRRSEFHGFDADGKEFEVVELSYNWEANTVTIIGREVDPSDFAWQASDATDEPPPPPPDLDPGLIPVDTPSVSAEGVSISRNGAKIPAIEITVANIDERATRIVAQVEEGDGEGGWTGNLTNVGVDPETGFRRTADGIVNAVDYRVRARVFVGEQRSEWSAWDSTASPDEYTVPNADDFTPGGTGDTRLADLSDLVAGLDDFSAEQIQDAIDNADQNAANLIEAVLDRYERDKENGAAIETERLTRISEDEAITQYTDSQLSVFNDSLAGVETEVTTVANDLEAFTQTTTTQFSVYDGNIAALETETTTLATDLQAEVTARTTAVAAVEDSVASLDQQVTLIANDQSAQATDISVLQAQFDDLSLNKASVTYVDQVVADAESALATSIQNIQAEVDGNTGSITTLQQSLADTESALSTRLQTVEAQAGDNSADINVLQTAVADLEDGAAAQYLVRVSAGAGVAGMQFDVSDSNGQVASDIRFFGQTIGFGTSLSSPRFLIDMNNNEVTGRGFNGVVTWRYDMSTGEQESFNAQGQKTWGNTGATYTGTPQITNADATEDMTSLDVSSAWTEVAASTVTVLAGSKVMVLCSLRVAAANWLTVGVAVEGRIKRDGTTIWEGEIASHPGFEEVVVYENGSPSADSTVRIPGRIDGLFSFFDLDTPPAGATAYTLDCRTTASVLKISERRMVAMEFRK